MADVKWIKITTDIFDDEKILLIESLPEADSIIVIWFKLLCLAGKMNNSGVFMLNDKVAYTDKMLATIFRRKESTVKLALETFEQFGMVEIVDDVITIPNWGKHQDLDKLESRKEYMRGYMQDYRKKQKDMIGVSKYNEAGLPLNDWETVLKEFDYKCAYCGNDEDLEQDHLVPVNKGGTYTVENIVPACRHCNASKGSKDAFKWYKEQSFYSEERCKHLRKHLRKSFGKVNVNEAEYISNSYSKSDSYLNSISKTVDERNYSDIVNNKIITWLLYKKEKGQSYKPIGLKQLLNKIDKQLLVYTEEQICSLIDECMEKNYQGIIWDILEKNKPNSSGSSYIDAIKHRLDGIDAWASEED